MTKIFATLAAVVTMATMVSAYTFSWGTGAGLTGRIQFGSGNYIAAAGDTANVANAAAYLIYLGADSTLDVNTDGTSKDEIVQQGSVSTAGLFGRGSGTYAKNLGTAYEDGSLFTDGVSTFAALITYTVDGKTYYNYSTTTYTITAGVQDNSPASVMNFTFNWDMDETGGDAPTAGGGWWTSAIIPEPMTVLCGLAGLALLLKRRA